MSELQQHANDLKEWLAERGIAIVLVAVGTRTGQPANIADWQPETHKFDYALVSVPVVKGEQE